MLDDDHNEKKQIELAYKGGNIEEEPRLIDNKDDYFQINNDEITALIQSYLQKTTDEDLMMVAKHGGVEGVAKKLRTDISKGLDFSNKDDIAKRTAVFGINALEEDEMKNCCQFVWESFEDLLIRILVAAAIIQTILGATIGEDPGKDWIDGLAIIIAVVVVVSVGSITNYSKEKNFKKLNDEKNAMTHINVTRRGENLTIYPNEILVGDIVQIQVGSIVPADGILISSSFICIDESPMTGESDHLKKGTYEDCMRIRDLVIEKPGVKKKDFNSPIVISGTLVVTGEGKFIVLSVGPRSQKGIIQELIRQSRESDDSKTPLEEKLDTIATQIGYFGMIAAFITLVALFIRFGVSYPQSDEMFQIKNQTATLVGSYINNDPNFEIDEKVLNSLKNQGTNPRTTISKSVLDIFLLVVAIVVVAIPEGLPLAVTLTLSFSIRKMIKQKNFVRNMHACETMGGANYICSDKTGTLTQNKMLVINVFDGHNDIHVEDATNKVENRVDPKTFFPNPRYYHDLKLGVILNIDVSKNEHGELGQYNKTDKSAYDMFVNLKEKVFEIRDKYLLEEYTKKIPFNSDRKRMTTIVKNSEFPTGHRLFIKGAPEILLDSISFYSDPSSHEIIPLDQTGKNHLKKNIIENYAKKALRNVMIAYKDITIEEYDNYSQQDDKGEFLIEKSNLVMLAILGIRDALRPGVEEAVKKCHTAGITVVMVTGDNIETAQAIAKQCSIIDNKIPDSSIVAMEGKKFWDEIGGIMCGVCLLDGEKCDCPKIKKKDSDVIRRDEIKNMERFKEIVKDLRVLARSRPTDKYALVLGLRKLENVVAVTGDGTNDAPALKRADVGFSMGKGGTDVAKDASDIMILDDNFCSIVTAVLWGRTIFDNIRKFIQFQLTVNVTACLLVFITACIGNESPLRHIQMLWLNLIMDSLGSLALATEPPNDKLLYRKPYKRSDHVISAKMWKHILIQSFFLLGLLLFLYLYAPEFIVENEPYRIAESNVIKRCYNKLPGRDPVQNGNDYTYYIINGSSANWSADVPLVFGMTSSECGKYSEKQDLRSAFNLYNSEMGGSAHLTIIFNVFVLYTLFNQINARIIDDDYNIFSGIQNNLSFIIIIFLELGLQIILIQFGSVAFKVSKKGLTGNQWGLCFGLASITFIVSILTKFFSKFFEKKDATEVLEVKNDSFKNSLDQSHHKLEPNIPKEKVNSGKSMEKRESVLKQLVLNQSKINRHNSISNSLRRSKKD